MAPKKKTADSVESIEVAEVQFGLARYYLMGTSPLIMNRFSQKAWQELLLPSGRKNRASLEQTLKHDPMAEFHGSVYKTNENAKALFHFPTGAFHKAIAQAAIDLPGAKRAQIERLTKVIDVNIELYGTPQLYMAMVRNSDINHTPDVRTRAIFPQWCCQINVRFIRPIITHHNVSHLVAAAGMIVGIGDWRSQKGGSFGAFECVAEDDAAMLDIMTHQGRLVQQAALQNPQPFDSDTETIFTWFNLEVKRREREGHLQDAELPDAELPDVPIHRERGNGGDVEYQGIDEARRG